MRVAIVGSGASGLTAIKTCLDYGYKPVCYEKAEDIGGLWRYNPEECDDGNDWTETFDAVLLCSGHHVEPYVPKFPGIERFSGRVMHSHSYKDHKGFEDKRVIVVGVGNSGGDIAVELSRISAEVYLVTRRGTWVWNRVSDKGYPVDCAKTTRFSQFIMDTFPNITADILEKQLNNRFDHSNYALKPAHRVFQAHPTVNDDLPNRILCGTVVVKTDIEEFRENQVLFKDGTYVDNVDTVILCTGYSFGFPYLEEGVIPVEENRVSLYKEFIHKQ